MVAIKQNRRARHRLRGGNSSGSSLSSRDRALGSALLTIFSFCCFCSFFLWSNRQDPYSSTSSIFRRDSSGIHGLQQATQQLDPIRPNLHLYDVLGDNAESLNAVAKDILDTLDCHRLLNRTSEDYGWGGGGVSYKAEINRVGGKEGSIRRLTETEAIGEAGPVDDRRAFIEKDENPAKKADWSREEKNSPRNGYGREEGGFRMDDLYPPNSPVTPTASHLFCVAALWASSTDPSDHVSYWKDQIQCPATVSRALTAELIELFSTARSEMSNELLLKTLQATEKKRELVGTNLDLWAPPNDDGIGYMLGVVNQKDGEWRHMRDNLGPGKLFVDVGSYLGVSGMAVALLYPGTQIVSVEAAAPNWLLQQVNWRCNHHLLFGAAPAEAEEAFREGQVGDRSSSQSSSLPLLPKVLLSGVGPTGHASHIAKMMWRPTATTATRSWTPQKEIKTSDVEITVHIKAWHSILQESGIAGRKIDVLNVDCEGNRCPRIRGLHEKSRRDRCWKPTELTLCGSSFSNVLFVSVFVCVLVRRFLQGASTTSSPPCPRKNFGPSQPFLARFTGVTFR
jgi:hypothetical protein